MLRRHVDAFAAMGGAPSEALCDRMKTAAIGESDEGVVSCNASPVALLNRYGVVPRACRPYRAQTKGKVERPYRCIRQDFFLARRFRDLEDLNRQFDAWRQEVANARRHAATRRIVAERFAEEQAALLPHPAIPCSAVLTVERRVGKDGMISVGGNLYSVPDATRRRVLEVQTHPRELRIFEDGSLIAAHPAPEGRNRRRDPLHRKLPLPQAPRPPEQPVGRRPPDFHEAVGRRLAAEGTAR